MFKGLKPDVTASTGSKTVAITATCSRYALLEKKS